MSLLTYLKPHHTAIQNTGSTAPLKRRMGRRTLSLVLVCLFLTVAVYYLGQHSEELARLKAASPTCLALVALLFIANTCCRGFFSLFVLRALNVRLSVAECLCLSFSSTMSNLLLPLRAGAGLRALYLKRFHEFPYTLFLSTMAALVVFFTFVQSLLGLTGLLYLAVLRNLVLPGVTVVIGAVFVSTQGMLCWTPPV